MGDVRMRIVMAELTIESGGRTRGQVVTSVTLDGKTRTSIRELGADDPPAPVQKPRRRRPAPSTTPEE